MEAPQIAFARKYKRHRDLATKDLSGACHFHLLPVGGLNFRIDARMELYPENILCPKTSLNFPCPYGLIFQGRNELP
jgi:hypothetical protein